VVKGKNDSRTAATIPIKDTRKLLAEVHLDMSDKLRRANNAVVTGLYQSMEWTMLICLGSCAKTICRSNQLSDVNDADDWVSLKMGKHSPY